MVQIANIQIRTKDCWVACVKASFVPPMPSPIFVFFWFSFPDTTSKMSAATEVATIGASVSTSPAARTHTTNTGYKLSSFWETIGRNDLRLFLILCTVDYFV